MTEQNVCIVLSAKDNWHSVTSHLVTGSDITVAWVSEGNAMNPTVPLTVAGPVAELDAIAWKLNTRPRKSLGFKCPVELFMPDAFDFKLHHAALFALGT